MSFKKISQKLMILVFSVTVFFAAYKAYTYSVDLFLPKNDGGPLLRLRGYLFGNIQFVTSLSKLSSLWLYNGKHLVLRKYPEYTGYDVYVFEDKIQQSTCPKLTNQNEYHQCISNLFELSGTEMFHLPDQLNQKLKYPFAKGQHQKAAENNIRPKKTDNEIISECSNYTPKIRVSENLSFDVEQLFTTEDKSLISSCLNLKTLISCLEEKCYGPSGCKAFSKVHELIISECESKIGRVANNDGLLFVTGFYFSKLNGDDYSLGFEDTSGKMNCKKYFQYTLNGCWYDSSHFASIMENNKDSRESRWGFWTKCFQGSFLLDCDGSDQCLAESLVDHWIVYLESYPNDNELSPIATKNLIGRLKRMTEKNFFDDTEKSDFGVFRYTFRRIHDLLPKLPEDLKQDVFINAQALEKVINKRQPEGITFYFQYEKKF